MASPAAPPSNRTTALRRWGPFAAVFAVLALVVGLVLTTGGDDDEPDTEAAGQTGTDGGGESAGSAYPTDAISFTRAEEEGLDATFADTCDTETGRVAMPFYFTGECYADQPAVTGEGVQGVTDDTITVVVYQSQENDPVLDFINSAIANEDTNADSRATFEGYTEMFGEMYQTYGRTVELVFLEASGISTDEVAARADAVRADEEFGAFAVWGGPVLSNAWTEELHARGVVCLGCPGIEEPAPYVFTVTASADQTRTHLAEYVEQRLAGRPAEHAGDPELQTQDRVFGHLYVDSGSQEAADGAAALTEMLDAVGAPVAEQVGYALDPATLQEQATSAIARFQSAGVTTVVFHPADPVAAGAFTAAATQQEWFPEWVLGGSALVDTAAFGRTYDQEQWANAFGISSLGARIDRDVSSAYFLYDWWFDREPEAVDSAGVIYPTPSLFFSTLQAAGPDLNPETFRQGIFSVRTFGDAITQPSISFGDRGVWPEDDYYGIDDFTELWWDPEAVGEDEIGREAAGMYRYVDGGARYLPGEWTDESRLFDPEGSITIYEELPDGELPEDYPRPGG